MKHLCILFFLSFRASRYSCTPTRYFELFDHAPHQTQTTSNLARRIMCCCLVVFCANAFHRVEMKTSIKELESRDLGLVNPTTSDADHANGTRPAARRRASARDEQGLRNGDRRHGCVRGAHSGLKIAPAPSLFSITPFTPTGATAYDIYEAHFTSRTQVTRG
jgi:hypothetical protein